MKKRMEIDQAMQAYEDAKQKRHDEERRVQLKAEFEQLQRLKEQEEDNIRRLQQEQLVKEQLKRRRQQLKAEI